MAKKKIKKTKKPAVKRLECLVCGLFFDEGAPHSMFCAGCRPNDTCEDCGAQGSAEQGESDVRVAKCLDCGAIFCSDCGNVDERQCNDCLDGEG